MHLAIYFYSNCFKSFFYTLTFLITIVSQMAYSQFYVREDEWSSDEPNFFIENLSDELSEETISKHFDSLFTSNEEFSNGKSLTAFLLGGLVAIPIEKKIKKYIKKIRSLRTDSSASHVAKILHSFRRFVNKVSGKKMTGEDLYKLTKKKINGKGFKIDPKLKSFFVQKSSNSKKFTNEYRSKEEAVTSMCLGGVLMGCGILIGVIPIGCPPAAPLCNTAARWIFGTGLGMLSKGFITNSLIDNEMENFSVKEDEISKN